MNSGEVHILITGSRGFVGQHLLRELASQGFHVHTLPREIDIRDREALTSFFATLYCDVVIHLAALSFVPKSFSSAQATYSVNFIGTLNVLEALKSNNFTGRFIFVSSSHVYGHVEDALLPLKEDTPYEPTNPYAVSKVAGEMLCYQWSVTDSIEIIITRSFNIIGPGQSSHFAISNFCMQTALINLGRQAPEIQAGNLEVTRDFIDVRDAARAYALLCTRGNNRDVFNICSGTETKLSHVLEILHEASGIPFGIHSDEMRMRSSDQKRIFGDPSKIQEAVGWKPKVPLNATIVDTYSWWLEKLKND